jgi:hypothetical protein
MLVGGLMQERDIKILALGDSRDLPGASPE